MPLTATKDRITDAAELFFSEHGFSPASVRQITERAAANLAAVNYHFGSKQDLYRQVLLRRIRPINEERIALLTEAEQLAGEHPVPLRAIVETLICPLMRRTSDPEQTGIQTLRLISRALIEPPAFLREELAREFDPLFSRYANVIGRALPALPPRVILLRLRFVLGALLVATLAQATEGRPVTAAGGPFDLEECLRRLVEFGAAGLGAPAAPSPS